MLSSLILANIPAECHALIIFIVNASTDDSKEIVENFLKRIVSHYPQPTPTEQPANSAYIGNIEFMLLNTPTRGKSNALNMANEIALQRKIEIAMSIDADTLLANDAICRMYAHAHKHIITDNDKAILCSGKFQGSINEKQADWLFSRHFDQYVKQQYSEWHVCGAFMGWNPEFFMQLGGFKKIASQDYAAGVQVRYAGGKIIPCPDAQVFGYVASNLREKITGSARSMRGRLQLLNFHPELQTLVHSDGLYLKPLPERFILRFMEIIGSVSPHKALARAVIDEISMIIGKLEYMIDQENLEYMIDQENPSWKKIKSSKL